MSSTVPPRPDAARSAGAVLDGRDERSLRQARARALAATIADSPQPSRRLEVPDGVELRGSERPRSHGERPRRAEAVEEPVRSPERRRIVALVLCAQLVLLAALLVAPTFHARTIDVQGTQLLSRDELLRAAGLSSSQSIFSVDGDAVRHRLEQQPWVHSASVETELPGTVRITIRERSPIFEVRAPGAPRLVVSETGSTLDERRLAVPAPALPVLLDERPRALGGSLAPELLRLLAATAQRFPAVYGTGVAGFDWQADGRLSIVASSGWRAVLGNENTAEQLARIPQQLAALASLQGHVDFAHPSFGYVDLTNPQSLSVGGTPAPAGSFPPADQPSPLPAPSSAPPSSAATPGPSPTAAPGAGAAPPAPTPLHFDLGAPPAH